MSVARRRHFHFILFYVMNAPSNARSARLNLKKEKWNVLEVESNCRGIHGGVAMHEVPVTISRRCRRHTRLCLIATATNIS
jgi:hypothetical protein